MGLFLGPVCLVEGRYACTVLKSNRRLTPLVDPRKTTTLPQCDCIIATTNSYVIKKHVDIYRQKRVVWQMGLLMCQGSASKFCAMGLRLPNAYFWVSFHVCWTVCQTAPQLIFVLSGLGWLCRGILCLGSGLLRLGCLQP